MANSNIYGFPVVITQPNGDKFFSCTCMQQWWPLFNRLAVKRGIVKQQIDVSQGSYSNSVEASAKTHVGGGVLDTRQHGGAYDDLLEECGAAGYERTPEDGFSWHEHLVLIGCPHLHEQAASQVRDWKIGRNALANHAADRDKTRPATIRTWSQGIKYMVKELAKSEGFDMANTTSSQFIEMFGEALDDQRIKDRLAIIAQAATYGRDIDRDGKTDTAGQMTANIADIVVRIAEKLGVPLTPNK